MKRLSLYLFLILFTLQNPSWADDIRDFQIEGMSIVDSLLEDVTKKEIKIAEQNSFLYENKKFLIIFAPSKSKVYDEIQITYKPEDKKYLIHAIDGVLNFPNNIKACREQMKEIVKEIEVLFVDINKSEGNYPHQYDKSGKSMTHGIKFTPKSGGVIDVYCTDWSDVLTKKNLWKDGLKVFVGSAELIKNIYK